jgi:uncharacterized protein
MLQVPDFQRKNRFRLDNPWWKIVKDSDASAPEAGAINAKVPEFSGPRRAYFQALYGLIEGMQANRAVVLMGPRRVGKTYLIKQIIGQLMLGGVHPQRVVYASLQTPLYTGMPLETMLGVFQEILQAPPNERLYVFFDEIQYLPQWEVHLKVLVDRFPQHRFVASGSAAAALRMKSQESGAGRFTDFVLPPMSFAEFLQFKGLESKLMPLNADGLPELTDIHALNSEFIAYMNYGGYPEAVLLPEIQYDIGRFIRSDIIDKVLLRDLPSLYGISNIQELNRLFTVLAFNTGQEISLEALGKDSGVAKNTLIRYLDYLEAAFLIQRITRVDENAQRMKRNRTFKVFLTNPSMRAALFGPLTEEDPAFGHVVESTLFSNLEGSLKSGTISYARWDRGGHQGEIDFVSIDLHQQPWGLLEVKWSDRESSLMQATQTLEAYIKNLKRRDCIALLTTQTQKRAPSHESRVRWIPTAEYCYLYAKERHYFESVIPSHTLSSSSSDFHLARYG